MKTKKSTLLGVEVGTITVLGFKQALYYAKRGDKFYAGLRIGEMECEISQNFLDGKFDHKTLKSLSDLLWSFARKYNLMY